MKLHNKKTGEIVDFRPFCFYQTDSRKFPSKIYESLSDLNEQWEDYKPKEPLIKDEKIRKAVRAWAEVCEIDSDDAIMVSGLAPAFTRFWTSMYEIDIKTESSLGLDEHRDYTIAELCGEEEAPEPTEPTFIDLDERIKEKEE